MFPKHTAVEIDDLLLEYQVVDGMVFLHLKVYSWSKSKYVTYLRYFREVLDVLKDKGVKYVYCLIDPNDKKLIKFEQMFGFYELITTEYGLVMERSTK